MSKTMKKDEEFCKELIASADYEKTHLINMLKTRPPEVFPVSLPESGFFCV